MQAAKAAFGRSPSAVIAWLGLALFCLSIGQTQAAINSSAVHREDRALISNVNCVKQLSSCSCETDSGGRVDLSPLAKSGGVFAFNDKTSPSGSFFYYYNPCYGATCDGSSDAAVCQKTNDKLQYSGLSGDQLTRETHLQLVCDTSGSGEDLLTPLDDGQSSGSTELYKMSLLSRHCCATGGPGPDGGGGGGMSGGDILLIIFFCLIAVYLAAGILINVAIRRQSFGAQALPNAEFWVSVPGLVRDGALFSYGWVKDGINKRRGNYESV
uniref:Cation-dependent mannose-6-phosphate receptor n=1 Tax=Macrostomum lignano TaxID=282301 RepID=A0A1I8JGM9_9PLAT